MTRIVRLIVLWLIALAIPVQGMAALVMPHCAEMTYAGAAGDAGHSETALMAHGHAAGGLAESGNDHHAGHHAAADPASNPGAADDAGHTGHPMLKCCSAACSMAAVMAPSLVAALPASWPEPLHPVVSLYRGFTPDGLERPPKTDLA